MEDSCIHYEEAELFLINGHWTDTNNCYGQSPAGVYGSARKTIMADASYQYVMYGDDFCCDALLYRVNGKWGLLLKTRIEGMGCASYQSTNSKPFVYDSFKVIMSGNVGEGEPGEHEEAFYADKKGYIAVCKEGKWGIICIYKKSWVPILEKLVVPCQYASAENAYQQISESSNENVHYIRHWYTPSRISHLNENQIFVFGSNLQGMHGGGAARYAMDHFGAVYGEGVGRTGQCYAIPTMHGGIEAIRPYVDEFIAYAAAHRELEFLVTPIGCGIAGFTEQEIAPLFCKALKHGNIILPEGFVREIEKKNN